MQSKTLRKFLFSGVIALLSVSFFGSALCIVNYTFLWNNDVKFSLSSYGTTIGFDDAVYLEKATFDNGIRIVFTNVLLDNNNVESLKFSTQTSNVTVTTLSDTKLVYSVTGSGTQAVYLDNKNPQSVIVDGSLATNGIDYSVSGGTTTITTATSYVKLNYQTDNAITAIASLMNNAYASIALLVLIPIVIVACLILLAFREQMDSQTMLVAFVSLITFTVIVLIMLVILPAIQNVF